MLSLFLRNNVWKARCDELHLSLQLQTCSYHLAKAKRHMFSRAFSGDEVRCSTTCVDSLFSNSVWTSESVTSVLSAESFNGLKGLVYLAKWKMKREVEEQHQSTPWWWAKNYRKVSQWDHTQAQTMNVLHTNTLITSLFPCWKTDVWQIVSVCVSHRLRLLASIGWITR